MLAIFKPRRLSSALVLGIVVCGILALVLQGLAQSRYEALDRARADLAMARQAAVGGTERLLQPYRLSLESVASGLDVLERHETDPTIRQILLFDSSTRAPFFSAIIVLDADGHVRYNSRDPSPARTDLSDRDYFRVFKNRTARDLYVSQPFRSQLSGDEIFVMALPVRRMDGSFGGVVAGAVRVAAIREVLGSDQAWRGAGALFRNDGVEIVASDPHVGRDVKPIFVPPATRKGMVEQTGPEGSNVIYAWGQLEGLPLVVVWSMSGDEVLASWGRRAIVVGAATCALLAIAFGFLLHVRRELKQRTEAERVLRKIVVESDRLARTDKLTGLGNRRMFDEVFEQEWRRHLRHASPISVILIDVDHFKRLNDSLGHGAGDAALVEIAASIRRGAQRSADFVSRYGGEEFVIILPDTTAAGARVVAERLRQDLAARELHHPTSPLGRISVSMGTATIVPSFDGPSRFDLLDAADAALYIAKDRGRDRVESMADWSSTRRLPAPREELARTA